MTPAILARDHRHYVSIIISKLQANDRTQAAILALKRGIATLE